MHDNHPQLAAMASAEPTKDLEPGLPSSHYDIIQEKDQTSVCSGYRSPSTITNSPRRHSNGLWASLKMSSVRRTTLTIFIVVFLTVVAYAAVPVVRRPYESLQAAKDTSFQDMLNSVPEDSLHNVLINVYKKYRHGIFPEDRTAMQAVHDEDAAVATSLVELARRQTTNITSATVANSSTATVVVSTLETEIIVQTSSTDGSVVVVETLTSVTPVPTTVPTDTPIQTDPPIQTDTIIQTDTTVQTDTPVQTTAPQVSPSPPSRPSSSVPAPSPSVNSSFLSPSTSPSLSSPADTTKQASPTSSPQVPGQTATDGGAGNGPDTTAPSTPPTTLVTTSSSTFTFTSTDEAGGSTPGANGAITVHSSSTEQVKYTTTLPDGSQSTVTSFTIVPAGDQATAAGAAGSTGTGTPGLQNGAVEGTQPRGMGVVGSLVAALVFVIGIL